MTRQLEADVAGRQRRAALRLLDFRRREKPAVGIERVREAAHRAVHHLVDADVLDVVIRDQVRHVLEHFQVLVRVFARHHLAEEAADNREDDDRRGNEQDDQPGAGAHMTSSEQGPLAFISF